MRNRRFQADSKGVALIETLVAFAVLAVGIFVLWGYHTESKRSLSDAKAGAEATALAEQKLQELESYLADSDSRLGVGSANDSVTGNLASYARSWTVSKIDGACTDGAPEPNYFCARKIAVTVAWEGRNYDAIAGNDNQTVRLSSEVHFREPSDGVGEFLSAMVQSQKDTSDPFDDADPVEDGAGGGGVSADDGYDTDVDGDGTEENAADEWEGAGFNIVVYGSIGIDGSGCDSCGVASITFVESEGSADSWDCQDFLAEGDVDPPFNDDYICGTSASAWAGIITFATTDGAVFCSGNSSVGETVSFTIADSQTLGTVTAEGNTIIYNTEFSVRVATNNGQCGN